MGLVFICVFQSVKQVAVFVFSFKRSDVLTCSESSEVHVLPLYYTQKQEKPVFWLCFFFYHWLFDMVFYYSSHQGAFISIMKTSWLVVRKESCSSPLGSKVSLQWSRRIFCSWSQHVLVLDDYMQLWRQVLLSLIRTNMFHLHTLGTGGIHIRNLQIQ